MNDELTSQLAAYANMSLYGGRFKGARPLGDLIKYVPALEAVLTSQGVNVAEVFRENRCRHYSQWTAEEDELIQDLNFKGYSYRAIAERVGRTRLAVASRIPKLARQRLQDYKEVDDADRQTVDN